MIEPPIGETQAPRSVPSAGPKIALALGVTAAILAAGTVFVLRSSAASSLDKQAPASAGAYVELNLRPGADQRDAIDQILGRLPVEQRSGITSGIDDMLEELFASLDLSWRNDVKGWIGTRVAVSFPAFTAESFLGGPKPVVLVAVRNEEAARASLQRAVSSGGGGGAFEIENGIAYIAERAQTLSSFRSDAERAALADDPAYGAERARHGDVLAFVWFNAGALSQFAPGLSGGQAGGQGPGTVAFSVRAEPLAIVLEGGSSQAETGTGDVPALLGSTSATLLGALTIFDVGSALEGAFNPAILGQVPGAGELLEALDSIALDIERDVAPWLKGEVSVIVGGVSGFLPDLGLLVEVTDEKALDRFAGKIRGAARRIARMFDVDGVRVSGDQRALRIRFPDASVFMRRARGKIAFALSERYANDLLRGSPDALKDDTVYRRAVGDAGGTVFQVFVRLDRIRQLITFGLPSQGRAAYDEAVGPLLGLFESAAVTAKADGRFRVVLTVVQ